MGAIVEIDGCRLGAEVDTVMGAIVEIDGCRLGAEVGEAIGAIGAIVGTAVGVIVGFDGCRVDIIIEFDFLCLSFVCGIILSSGTNGTYTDFLLLLIIFFICLSISV